MHLIPQGRGLLTQVLPIILAIPYDVLPLWQCFLHLVFIICRLRFVSGLLERVTSVVEAMQ